jgi:hypothetical protein
LIQKEKEIQKGKEIFNNKRIICLQLFLYKKKNKQDKKCVAFLPAFFFVV